jgi:hypothetical protein
MSQRLVEKRPYWSRSSETLALSCHRWIAGHSRGTAGAKPEEGEGDGRSVYADSASETSNHHLVKYYFRPPLWKNHLKRQSKAVTGTVMNSFQTGVESYLAGVITGDGHLEKNSNRVVLFSNNAEFARILNSLLGSLGYRASAFYDKTSKEFRIAIRSKRLHHLLSDKYNIKPGAKSVEMGEPKVDKGVLRWFLAGIFDAEGWHELDKKRYHRIRLKMKNKNIVSFIYKSLRELDISARYHQRRDGSFVVEVNRQKDLKKFLNLVAFFHPRWLLAAKSVAGGGSPESPGLHAGHNAQDNGMRPRKGKPNP